MSNTSLLGSFGGQAGDALMFRNRILNGCMRIDQRWSGTEITPTPYSYTVDRWSLNLTQSSKLKIGRNAGAVTPPSGFTNYLGITSLSSYSLVGNDAFSLQQVIEGFNISDFGWGTADAKPATLSFWVRSSLTGTFGGSIATTGSGVWVLPFSFTISSANTWTYITVSIPAGTSALTNNDNSAGIFVRFGLGSTGTSIGGTAGTWTNAGNYIQPAGTVSLVGTNGATFYITGVQLESGAATPFERRPIGQELALAQRYYTTGFYGFSVIAGALNIAEGYAPFKVTMRATPIVAVSATQSSIALYTASPSAIDASGFQRVNNTLGNFSNSVTPVAGSYTANAEL